MKTSLIMTLKNEEATILPLLRSIIGQSIKPDELIIVDGGSTDRTLKIINQFQLNKEVKIRVFVKPGYNISQGRNFAIKMAKHELILVTDGGCLLNRDWVEQIIKPFSEDKELEVVFGSYKVFGKSYLGKALASFFNQKTKGNSFSNSVLSSRSVAFKKKAWFEVGGYPERLYTGEDSLFFINLKNNCKWILAKSAIVKWEHNRESLYKIYKMCFLYGKGSAQAKIWIFRSLLFIGIYLIGFLLFIANIKNFFVTLTLLILAFIFLSRGSINSYNENKSLKFFLITPIVLFVRDLGIIIGYIVGMISSPKSVDDANKKK